MPKSEFRRVLKDKINVKRREFLIDLQSKHKKTRELVIGDEVSQYLVSNKITQTQKNPVFMAPSL